MVIYCLIACFWNSMQVGWRKILGLPIVRICYLSSLVLDLDNLGWWLYLDCFQVICIKLSHSVLKKKLNSSSETIDPETPLLICRAFSSKQIDLILEEKCNGSAFWSVATWWGLSLLGNGLYVVTLFEFIGQSSVHFS